MSDVFAIVPELYCSSFATSRDFYTRVCGFTVRYERPESRFALLGLGAAELMIEQTVDSEARLVSAPLERPYGRGMNLEITVDRVEPIHRSVRAAGAAIFLDLHDRWYRRDDVELGRRQFVAVDPDGYLLRFAEDLGERPV